MAISFCDKFNIDKNLFSRTGALDIILDIDIKYFIDPVLLRTTKLKEFKDATKKIEKYFSDIIILMKHSQNKGDMYWKTADKLISFKELKATCLGYSNESTSGNAIGKKLRDNVLTTIKELLKTGQVDPVIFELLGVFQEKIGCDRISDLVTYILEDEIKMYTINVFSKIGIKDTKLINPYNREEIMLLPKELLSPLPIAESFKDINMCCQTNIRVREEINKYLNLNKRKILSKDEIKILLKCNEDFRKEIVESYKIIQVEPYNFDIDSSGQIIWYEKSKQVVHDYPVELRQPHNKEELLELVMKICDTFKKLIEANGLWKILYDDNENSKRESVAQLLFYGIADAYCKANNIDISREVNNGQGPVDFKFSSGYKNRVLVEIKLTSNGQLLHGIKPQLPIYMKQEETEKAIYLIIDNGHEKRLKSYNDYYNDLDEITKRKIKSVVIDGKTKLSASRA